MVILSTAMKHRKKRFKSHLSSFTLIELLVVISIISLLSSIVFSSLNSARIKAKNVKIITDIHFYTQVFELYRSDHDEYPAPTNPTYFACLGDYPTDKCWQSNVTPEDIAITNALKEYAPQLPINTEPMYIHTGKAPYLGYRYRCGNPLSGDPCDTVLFAWYLFGRASCSIRGGWVIRQFNSGYDTECEAWYPEIPPEDNF
jgi:prepilin-type N-terminal cleavage/methylation domain-containing protein